MIRKSKEDACHSLGLLTQGVPVIVPGRLFEAMLPFLAGTKKRPPKTKQDMEKKEKKIALFYSTLPRYGLMA